METAKRISLVLILVLLMAAAAQPAEGPAKISNTRTASCLVKVTCDPVVLPLSFETIDFLMHSSAVAGKAIREVLDVSPDQVRDGVFAIGHLQELTSNATPRPSGGRSPGRDDEMPENEYKMMMEAEYGMDMARNVPGFMPGPSTRFSRGKDSYGPSRRNSPTPRTITTSALPADEKSYLFSLRIELSEEVKPAAEEFMDALVYSLRNALTNTFDEYAGRLKGQLQLAEEEAARAEGDLRQKQDQLREISGSHVLERGSILGEINSLRNEIQRIEMSQTSDQVIVDTTTQRIAELQNKIKAEIEKDTITDELNRLLFLQEKNVRDVEKLADSGRASTTDLADAQEKLTRARIELAQRQEQLSKSKGGNQIESLNSTLTDLSMGVAQYRAQLAGYEQQLAQAEALLSKADEYELLSLKADVAKQNLQEAIVWRDRISRQIRMLQSPAVSVIGGD